jgi:hypothetical protein
MVSLLRGLYKRREDLGWICEHPGLGCRYIKAFEESSCKKWGRRLVSCEEAIVKNDLKHMRGAGGGGGLWFGWLRKVWDVFILYYTSFVNHNGLRRVGHGTWKSSMYCCTKSLFKPNSKLGFCLSSSRVLLSKIHQLAWWACNCPIREQEEQGWPRGLQCNLFVGSFWAIIL